MEQSFPSAPRTQEALTEAMDQLWVRFLPKIRERVGVLAAAAEAAAAGKLAVAQRKAAQAAAHKLSGVLGAFGLTRGTAPARELEVIFSRDNALGPDAGAHLSALAEELRETIENRPSAG